MARLNLTRQQIEEVLIARHQHKIRTDAFRSIPAKWGAWCADCGLLFKQPGGQPSRSMVDKIQADHLHWAFGDQKIDAKTAALSHINSRKGRAS